MSKQRRVQSRTPPELVSRGQPGRLQIQEDRLREAATSASHSAQSQKRAGRKRVTTHRDALQDSLCPVPAGIDDNLTQ